MSTAFYATLEDSFALLNPYEKAKFIAARLEYAGGDDLSAEVTKRLCEQRKIEQL